MPITQPDFIPQPWANGNASYRADVPSSAADAPAGRASWQMGYPPSTSLPLEAGGYAPARLDFNGGLYALSAHVFFQQSGSMYEWDGALDYNVGAAVLGSDGNEYRCVAANGVSTTVKDPVLDVSHTYWKPLALFLTDIIYPVGSIYMTTSSANPGTVFGGTWAKIQDRFLLGSGSSRAAGETGGSSTYSLTVSNMPSHNHGFSLTAASNGAHTHSLSGSTSSAGAHTHTRGSMNITGSIRITALADRSGTQLQTIQSSNGAFSNTGDTKGGTGHIASTSDNWYQTINLNAASSWTGSTSSAGAHTHTISGTANSAGNHTHSVTGSIGNSGGNVPFSVMPPYFVVNIWQRTA